MYSFKWIDHCKPKEIAKEYILHRANFAFGYQKITVYKNGVEKYSTTMHDFMLNNKSEKKENKVNPIPSDAALNCESDNTFTVVNGMKIEI